LVVEDNDADFRLIAESAKEAVLSPFAVVRAKTSSEALKIVGERAVDVVLLDLGLPDSVGLTTLKKITGEFPHLPVVVQTGLDDEKLGLDALQNGAQDYLVKGRAQGDAVIRAVRHAMERKRVENALRQSEDRYRTLFTSLIEGYCVIEVIFDPAGRPVDYRFLEINPAFEEQTGLHDAQGKLMRDLAPDHEAHWFEIYGKVASTGEPARLVNEAKALNRWFQVYACRVGGPESRKVAICFNDITERMRAEKALRESEERFKAIAETTPVGIGVIGVPGAKFLYVNPTYQKVFGYAESDLLGKETPPIYWNLEDRERILETLKARGFVADYEVKLKRKDGTPFWGLSSVRPITFGGAPALLGSFIDITDRKRAEEFLKRDKEAIERIVRERTEELVEARVDLERSKRLSDVGMLATTVAHELRNPLASINLAAINIKRKANNPDLDKHLESIRKKVVESDQIIGNLLFYSRLRPPQYEKVDLFSLLGEALESMEDGRNKGISVVRNIDPIKDLSIEADPTQLKEVFHNILNNAHDSLPSEGGRIKVGAENEGEFIRVFVEDNGSGIEKKDLEKVFDPFFTTKSKGTGLGLSVCKQIVSMHEGDIGIKSEPDQGTTVIVRLPKQKGAISRRVEWGPVGGTEVGSPK